MPRRGKGKGRKFVTTYQLEGSGSDATRGERSRAQRTSTGGLPVRGTTIAENVIAFVVRVVMAAFDKEEEDKKVLPPFFNKHEATCDDDVRIVLDGVQGLAVSEKREFYRLLKVDLEQHADAHPPICSAYVADDAWDKWLGPIEARSIQFIVAYFNAIEEKRVQKWIQSCSDKRFYVSLNGGDGAASSASWHRTDEECFAKRRYIPGQFGSASCWHRDDVAEIRSQFAKWNTKIREGILSVAGDEEKVVTYVEGFSSTPKSAEIPEHVVTFVKRHPEKTTKWIEDALGESPPFQCNKMGHTSRRNDTYAQYDFVAATERFKAKIVTLMKETLRRRFEHESALIEQHNIPLPTDHWGANPTCGTCFVCKDARSRVHSKCSDRQDLKFPVFPAALLGTIIGKSGRHIKTLESELSSCERKVYIYRVGFDNLATHSLGVSGPELSPDDGGKIWRFIEEALERGFPTCDTDAYDWP